MGVGNREVTLRQPTETKIARWVKVRGRSSPYDSALRAYWTKRHRHAVAEQTNSWQKLRVLRRQRYQCGQCHVVFQAEDSVELHHRVPLAEGGPDTTENLMAVHEHCHHQIHHRCGRAVRKA